MRYFFFIVSLLSFSLFFNACGSNSGGSNSGAFNLNTFNFDTFSSNTFTQSEKEFVHKLFLTEYLWYDEVASNVDYTQYTTRDSLINDLRVTPPDIWSFSLTKAEYEDISNQAATGFGFGYTSNFQIFLVRIDAPAYGKLFRGDEIVAINGKEVTKTLMRSASQDLNNPTTFTLLRNGETLDVEVTPSAYTFKSTLGKVMHDNNKTVGYLRYDAFTESSATELEKEFTQFKKANIDELVIDLRYNGGGDIAVASILLENISNAHPGERQVYLDWNENYKQNNSTYYFSDEVEPNDLNMTRVFFLVTKNSASASELVISALKPYLGKANVITIGTPTHGKPVGMNGRVYGDNYYFLINFFVRNDAGDTTSFEGIPPTCEAEDDLSHVMGDANETMYKSALHYISTGVCL